MTGITNFSECEFTTAGTDLFAKPAATPPRGPPESALPSKILILVALGTAGGIFGLFQLGLLPKSWIAVVSKVYFWPTLPFTVVKRFHNYWTKMDGERATCLVCEKIGRLCCIGPGNIVDSQTLSVFVLPLRLKKLR